MNPLKLFTLFCFLSLPLTAEHIFHDIIFHADKVTGTQSTMRLTSDFSGVPPRGFYPLTLMVENNTTRETVWKVAVESNDGHAWGGNLSNKLNSSYTFRCPPGERIQPKMLVPVVTALNTNRYQGCHLSIDVNYTGSGRPDWSAYIETHVNTRLPSILMSERLYRQNGSRFKSEYDKKKKSRMGGIDMDFKTHFQPTSIPSDWRAFSGFDVLMFTYADWGEMSSGGQRAILEWARMGGALYLYAVENKNRLKQMGLPEEGRYGWGSLKLKTMGKDEKITPKLFLTDMQKAPQAGNDLINNYRNGWNLKEDFGVKSNNFFLLIFVLVIFAILVGPMNLFVFAKEGQRHRLFITTPIISLITTLLLFIVILLKDGIGGKGITHSLIEIDKASNALYGAQEQVARTGMLLKSGFKTEVPALIDPIMLNSNNSWARVKKSKSGSLKGNSTQYLATVESPTETSYNGDYFLSRTESAHLIHYKKPFRQGVDIIKKGTDTFALSSLEVTLEDLYFFDGKNYFHGKNVKQGVEVKLNTVTSLVYKEWMKTQKSRLGKKNQSRVDESFPLSGYFFATCEDWPHFETLNSINWKKNTALLTGKVTP